MTSMPLRGLGVIDQRIPFHVSIRAGLESPPEPTATHVNVGRKLTPFQRPKSDPFLAGTGYG
jgi:hypothetical protein